MLSNLCALNLRTGARDIKDLQAHPFFDGVIWDSVREGPPPPFATLQHPYDDFNEGLDWETNSIVATLPVAYQAHEGAPIFHTSGGDHSKVCYAASDLEHLLFGHTELPYLSVPCNL